MEEYIFTLIQKIKRDKIIIYITHKIESVKKICDNIYLIADKKSEVFGSHDQLMKSENIYSDYYKRLLF